MVEAKKLIDFLVDNNIKWRITRNDDNHCIITCDFVPERWNLEIDNGNITKIDFG